MQASKDDPSHAGAKLYSGIMYIVFIVVQGTGPCISCRGYKMEYIFTIGSARGTYRPSAVDYIGDLYEKLKRVHACITMPGITSRSYIIGRSRFMTGCSVDISLSESAGDIVWFHSPMHAQKERPKPQAATARVRTLHMW